MTKQKHGRGGHANQMQDSGIGIVLNKFCTIRFSTEPSARDKAISDLEKSLKIKVGSTSSEKLIRSATQRLENKLKGINPESARSFSMQYMTKLEQMSREDLEKESLKSMLLDLTFGASESDIKMMTVDYFKADQKYGPVTANPQSARIMAQLLRENPPTED